MAAFRRRRFCGYIGLAPRLEGALGAPRTCAPGRRLELIGLPVVPGNAASEGMATVAVKAQTCAETAKRWWDSRSPRGSAQLPRSCPGEVP